MTQERINEHLTAYDLYQFLKQTIMINGSEKSLEVRDPEAKTTILFEIGGRRSGEPIRIVWIAPTGNYNITLQADGPGYYEKVLQEHDPLLNGDVHLTVRIPLCLSTQRANDFSRRLFAKIVPPLTKAGMALPSLPEPKIPQI